MNIIEENIKVLIVDTQFSEIQNLKIILDKSHYKILAANESASAWQIVQNEKPDLVFIVFSGLDHLSLLMKIRENYSAENMPVVMIGNRDEENAMVETFDLGANDYILKPYNRKGFLFKLHALLKNKKINERYTEVKNRLQETFSNLASKIEEHEALQHHVNDLTDKLQKAKKLETIGMLTAEIVHDLNTHLGGILGYASLLKDKTTDKQTSDRLKHIETSAERAALLVLQILSFIRKDNNQKEEVQLNDLISEIYNTNLIHKVNDHTNIHFKLEKNLWPLLANPTKITQIISNLGVNAIDAIKGKGDITFLTENKFISYNESKKYGGLQPNRYVHLAVIDTGSGISQQISDKIFEPFFSTKNEKGTGLGLSAVKEAVSSHKGTILCDTKDGEGTTFHVFLPATENSISENEDTKLNSTKSKSTHSQKCFNILIVDDDANLRSLVGDIFEEKGYGIFSATNGEEALDIFFSHQNEIDLVILDVMMPKMNGYETYLKIKETNPNMRILFNSGYIEQPQLQTLVKNNHVNFIQKPYTASNFLNVASELLFQA